METPFLPDFAGDHHQLIGLDGDYRPVKSLKQWWAIFWIETFKLWEIGGPIAFNIICQFGIYSITVAFCGHLGAIELSAVSVAQNVIGTFSFGCMLGMGSALETLCGQAFGAGQIHMLGVYTQRSMIILLFSTFILLPIYIFATPVLKLLGQEHDIAVLAGKFAMLTIPELYSLAITIPTSKFLQAQSKVCVLASIGFVALLLHAVLLWLFIYVFNWGTNGAALAFNVTGWANAMAQFVYVLVWCKDGWTGWSSSAFNEIWAFVRLSVSSAVMLCLEMWYMMSIIILTGHLKDAVTSVGSLSICMNVDGWEAMLFIGINAAISVRVSNELGLGRPRATKYSVFITVFQSLLIGIVCMIVVLAVRNHLAILFTNSKDLQRAVADLAWLLGITMLLNSVQPVISGVAIGGGWQGLVAYINLGSYYVFGIPLGYILGYVANFGVVGLWGGMIAGLALQTLLLSFVLYRIDWNKEVELSAERMRKWGGQVFEAEKPLITEPTKGLP
ncbi:protein DETOXIFICATION 35-like [Nicotiana tabacum]|uniref:Protein DETOXIFICATION n=1 Tax=Nicotiana tabacum TaxID=4097 RepID=A0A1S3YS20_TOBAC|nr:protein DETOXIFICATION 35-like [Nicotiana tomentosiformis]XP_016454847.1 PREDICTED: protein DETOXIFICATION 35-like [Nicotiana tabacum]